MGLDMYLYLRKSNYRSDAFSRFGGQMGEDLYPKALASFEAGIRRRNFPSVSTEADYQIGYWRKFNALHAYIESECDAYSELEHGDGVVLDWEAIERIISTLKEVKETHEKAPEALPTKKGFFFGRTEYDDDYFSEVEYSIGIFEKAKRWLEESKSTPTRENFYETWELVYKASW